MKMENEHTLTRQASTQVKMKSCNFPVSRNKFVLCADTIIVCNVVPDVYAN